MNTVTDVAEENCCNVLKFKKKKINSKLADPTLHVFICLTLGHPLLIYTNYRISSIISSIYSIIISSIYISTN